MHIENLFSLWNICLILSIGFFVWFILHLFLKSKKLPREQWLPPIVQRALLVIASAISWFIPAYYTASDFPFWLVRLVESLLQSLQHTMRLFSGDDGFDYIVGILHPQAEEAGTVIAENVFVFDFFDTIYQILGNALFLIAPIFTFLFIISLIKNMAAFLSYKFCIGKDMHIFSELNEKSVVLAKSIYKKYNQECNGADKNKKSRKVRIVFADIIDKNEEAHLDLVDEAKEIHALLFHKDIESFDFTKKTFRISVFEKRISKKKPVALNFYLISSDESEKIRHAKYITKTYDNENNHLYYFSDSQESKYLLAPLEDNPPQMDVQRINDIRFLIYEFLHENGKELLSTAYDENGLKTIHITIVGFGKYGIELLKALLGFAQIPGHKIDITVLDQNEEAESKFKWMCPDLKTNTHYNVNGDMKYYIEFKQCSIETDQFAEEIKKLPENGFIFVCLGQDAINMTACDSISRLKARYKKNFKIASIIYNSNLSALMPNDFLIFGDLNSFYSLNTLIENPLVEQGLQFHERWKCDQIAEEKRNALAAQTAQTVQVDQADQAKRESETQKKDKADLENHNRKYYINEYEFYSSFSRALHRECREYFLNSINDPASTVESNCNMQSEENAQASAHFMESSAKLALSDSTSWYRYILERTTNRSGADKLKAELRDYQEKIIKGRPSIKNLIETIPIGKYIADEQTVTKPIHTLDEYIVDKQIAAELKSALDEDEANKFVRFCAICKYAANIDHIRWNAYMRTEGFIFGTKNFKAKIHPNLVVVNQLTLKDCIKDV